MRNGDGRRDEYAIPGRGRGMIRGILQEDVGQGESAQVHLLDDAEGETEVEASVYMLFNVALTSGSKVIAIEDLQTRKFYIISGDCG